MKKILSLALIAAIGSFWSCQKEATVAPQQPEAVINNANARIATTQDLEDVAILVAKTLEDVEVRKAIKAEALKQFDGDYDILYKNFAEFTFADGEKFKEKLAKAGTNNQGRTSAEAESKLDEIASITPLLNIAVPVNIDKWEAEAFTPLVAVRPIDNNEKTTEKLKAFDTEGKMHWLDALEEPTMPVIVIGQNDRVDEEGKLLFPPGLVTPKKSKSGRTMIDSWGPYNRDYINYNNYPETIESCGFTSRANRREYEPWYSGDVELQLRVVTVDTTGFQISPINWIGRAYGGVLDHSEFDSPKWVQTTIFSWDYYIYGDRVKYVWYEMDDGGNYRIEEIEVEANLKGQFVKVKVKLDYIDDNDRQIGGRVVYFTQNVPYTYDVGGVFKFTTVQY